GGELHLQAAPAGRDVDGVVAGGGGVDHGGQPLALAERADAASHVAGGPLGGGRVGHGGLLAARRRGQGLEAQRGADRHHRDGEGAVHLGDQRLEDPVVRDAERVGGLLAVGGAAVPGGLVGVQGEVDLRPGRGDRGGGALPALSAFTAHDAG